MRSVLVPLLAAGFIGWAAGLAGCDAILGIGDHSLAEGPDTGGPTSVTSSTSTSSTPLGGAEAGSSSANAGGVVASLYCSEDASACVVGAIESVGRIPGDGGTGIMADGGLVTLSDDGFELGGTSCDSTGMHCVTGGLSP
jgi:hypothetical protein